MTSPQTPAVAPPVAAAGTNRRGPSTAADTGPGPRPDAEHARPAPRVLGSQDIEYAVLYTAPEAFAGTVAHIRHHRSSAEAMARSENNHPQHPDLRCHVVTRTVTYSEWTPIETGSG